MRRYPPGDAFCKEGLCIAFKKEAVFLTDSDIDAEAVKAAIDATGYTCLSVESADYKKKGWFGRR